MKFHFFAAAAALALAISGSNNGVAGLTVAEADSMRAAIEDEMQLFKKKDREARMKRRSERSSSRNEEGGEGEGGGEAEEGGEAGEAGGARKPAKNKNKNKKIEGVKFADGVSARRARAKQKMLMMKINILDLVETASAEDLDAMLAIYDQMEELHANAAEVDDPKRHAGRDPQMKVLRSQLDEIAEKYGGLKRGAIRRHRQKDAERSFSPEDAAKVKELRKQLRDTEDADERKELRKQLQNMYGKVKFGDREERRKQKDERRKNREGEADERRAARKAEREARRVRVRLLNLFVFSFRTPAERSAGGKVMKLALIAIDCLL